jgi:hypothetical protein
MKDLVKLTMDELHGILMAYEMKTNKENPSKREANFKSSKKTKKIVLKYCNCKEYSIYY